MADNFFKEQRKELKLTQQDPAVLLGVKRVTYNKYENDPDLMPLGQYKKLIVEFDRLRKLKGGK